MSTLPSSVPKDVLRIARRLEESGHDAWAVGGSIRDVLLKRQTADWDLATSARPEEVRRIFRRTVPIGVEHGTVGVLGKDGTMYEVTTFRRDVETDGRHAVVAFADTIEEDLARRDFTINAIAWHPLEDRLLDPFEGAADLDRRLLRTVGTPDERFREDYLRVLRALRFASLFRMEIAAATWSALCGLVHHLGELSAERIRDELVKVLSADREPSRALDLYGESGALAVLYPELEALRARGDPAGPWRLSISTLDRLPAGRPMLRLASLLRELDPRDAAAILSRSRFSNAQVDETARRSAASPLPAPEAEPAEVRRWLSGSGPDRLAALARLDLARALAERDAGMGERVDAVVAAWREARAVRAAGPPLTVADLELDGRGLIALGFRPGPAFGDVLGGLLDWVLEDPSRNRKELLASRALELAGGGEGG